MVNVGRYIDITSMDRMGMEKLYVGKHGTRALHPKTNGAKETDSEPSNLMMKKNLVFLGELYTTSLSK